MEKIGSDPPLNKIRSALIRSKKNLKIMRNKSKNSSYESGQGHNIWWAMKNFYFLYQHLILVLKCIFLILGILQKYSQDEVVKIVVSSLEKSMALMRCLTELRFLQYYVAVFLTTLRWDVFCKQNLISRVSCWYLL